jgi:hypothetical protein
MDFQKIYIRLVKIFTISLAVILFGVITPAFAAIINTAPFQLKADIKNGAFVVDTNKGGKTTPNPLTAKTVVRRAILVLPDGEFGTIKSIKIDGITTTGDNQNIFGCGPINVKNGLDLIKTCGGPAEINGNTSLASFRYQAEGLGFGPNPNTKLEIVLFDDF